ncbi:MAG: hypothetical protein ACQESR_30955 [Planctomycetota bacterium]
MSENPFEMPVTATIPTRSVTKTRIVWFLLGFVCSWICWSTIAYIRTRPRDVTHAWPEELREMAPDWMEEAKGVVVGQFALFTPADSSSANAIVYPVKSPSTGALFFDEDGDCQLDEITVTDAKQRTWSVSFNSNQREAGSFSFSSGFSRDSVTFMDGNVDGQYDTCYRFDEEDPEPRMSVWIDSQWHNSAFHDGEWYVTIDGSEVAVERVDGVWQRASVD